MVSTLTTEDKLNFLKNFTTCRKCEKIYEKTEEHFYKARGKLQCARCKICCREDAKKRAVKYSDLPEKKKEARREAMRRVRLKKKIIKNLQRLSPLYVFE